MSVTTTYVVLVRVALPVEGFDREHAAAVAEARVAGALAGAGIADPTVSVSRLVPLLAGEERAGKCRVVVEGPSQ